MLGVAELGSEGKGDKKDMVLRGLWNNAVPLFRKQGGDIFGSVVKMAAQPIVHDDAAAERIGKIANSGAQIAVSTSANIRDFTTAAKESRERVGDLLKDVAPVLVEEFGKSSRGKLLRSKNEVVSHKRHQLMGLTKYNFFKAGAGLTDKIPDLFAVVDRKRSEIEERGENEAPVRAPEDDILNGTRLAEVRDRVEIGIEKAASSPLFDPDKRLVVDTVVRTGVPAIQDSLMREGEERFGQICAFDMIRQLAEDAETGSIRTVYTPGGEQLDLEDYILEIFKQHQSDMKGPPINDRSRFLPELREVCARIAKEIDDNQLDPMVLVSLVGNRQILDKKLRVADSAKLDEALQSVGLAAEKAQDIDTKEFISETAFATQDDFKAILKGLPEEDKAFFASLFPVPVLKEMGGLKDGEIEELKQQGAAEFADHMMEAVRDLASLDDEALQRSGLTREEARLIGEFFEMIEEMGEEAVKEELHGEMKEALTDAVRNARGYWEERVSGDKPKKNKAKDDKGQGGDEVPAASFVERLKGKVGEASEIER